MEREIKFRGLGIDGKWWYGETNPQGENHVNLATFFANAHGGAIRPETIGQWTGLLDKNGVEIFEGDVINLIPEGYAPYSVEVRWDDAFACFGFWGVRQDDNAKKCGIISIDRFLNHARAYKSMKVIGNIWENKELLE